MWTLDSHQLDFPVTTGWQYPIINRQGNERLVSANATWHRREGVSEPECLCDVNDI